MQGERKSKSSAAMRQLSTCEADRSAEKEPEWLMIDCRQVDAKYVQIDNDHWRAKGPIGRFGIFGRRMSVLVGRLVNCPPNCCFIRLQIDGVGLWDVSIPI